MIDPTMACYQWTCINKQAEFAPRDGAGALVFQDRMWLLGGWNPDDKTHFPNICNSEVWTSTDGAHWTLALAEAPWAGRHTAGDVVHQDCMWIIGGDANQGHYQSDVWRSPDGLHWERVSKSVPWGPRVLHHTVVFDGKIWVMGGQTLPQFAKAPECFYSDVWCSQDGRDWQRVLDDAPWGPCGMIGGQAVFNDRMWLMGGGTYSTPDQPTRQRYNHVWSSKDGIAWREETTSAPWTPRQYHDVAVFDNRLWVMEGCDSGGNQNDVWCSTNGTHWESLPDTPWPPRHAASVFVFNNALWMVAGNNMTSDVWKLSIQAGVG